MLLVTGFALAVSPAFGAGTPVGATPATQLLLTQEGAGADRRFGDFTASQGGLDEPFHYYLEASPGLTRLVVDLFDADVLAGAGEQAAGRDRMRGNSPNTQVRYRLFDPDGNPVPISYGSGTSAMPAGGDGAWLRLYDSATADTAGGDTFLEAFTTVSFTNDDGTVAWAGPWIEADDDGLPGSGRIRITGGELSMHDNGDFPNQVREPRIERRLDLSPYTSASLSFSYRTTDGIDPTDEAVIEISTDGGGSWTVLESFLGHRGALSGTVLLDLAGHLAADTRIRFRLAQLYAGSNEFFLVDDVQVRAVARAAAPPAVGHWRLTVDMSTAQTIGDDVNAFGLRAHDGDPGAAGREVHIYSDTFHMVGLNDNGLSRNYDFYPYVTHGCSARLNEFDWDATPQDPHGRFQLTSPSGAFVHGLEALSADDSWRSTAFSGWTSASSAGDYGAWAARVQIRDTFEGNYGLFYLGDSASANPDPGGPTAQPEPSTFRLYLPTDAGAAPPKPSFDQYLTYRGGPTGGPNPPLPGVLTRYVVSLVVRNPSAAIGSIAFSTPADVVTAYVPGGQAVYGGTLLITHGSVVSEPSLGGSGDVVWNPGTLAPGAIATLSYVLEVTPDGTGDVTATGTFGSGDGTRAVFVDETGDVSTRARQTAGELCDLRVQLGGATPALVSSLAAYRTAAGTAVEWRTAAEAGTIGFDLYRVDEGGTPSRVTPRPVDALLSAPQGGVYRTFDASAGADDSLTYYLVEHQADGAYRHHGPWNVAVKRPDATVGKARLRAHSRPHPTTATRAGRPSSRTPEVGDALHLGVGEESLYRLSAADIAGVLGWTADEARSEIARYRLRLSRAGQDVAWSAEASGNGLVWVGRELHTPYTDENVYHLAPGAGTVMSTRRGDPPAGAATTTFFDTVRAERDLRPVVLLPLDPEGDFWFWDFVTAGGSGAFPLDLPPPADVAGTGELQIDVQGAAPGEHRLEVDLGGTVLGEMTVDGTAAASASFAVDQSLIGSGQPTVEVTSLAGGLVAVDGFEIAYVRLHRAKDDLLRGRTGVSPIVVADGFSGPGVRVFDLGDPDHPAEVPARTERGAVGYRASFTLPTSGTPFVAVGPSAVRSPRIAAQRGAGLLDAAGAEYLVIAPAELLEAAAELARYRQRDNTGRGLSTRVVDLADIYNEVRHGIADPRAIREFLAAAVERWSIPPRYVVLAGAGTYDYRDLLGLGGNLVPPLLASRGDSLFATDALFGDLDADGAAEIAVGRLPVTRGDELLAYLAKVAVYEAASGAEWGSRVVGLADDGDSISEFGADRDALADLVPPFFATPAIGLDEGGLDMAREALFSVLEDGAALLTFHGHGGVDRLAAEGLLTSADVATLANAERPPLVTAVSCHIGFHALPGFDSLGEHLVRADGGAIAVWAPAWLSEHPQAKILADRFYRRLFVHGERVLGDATVGTVGDALAGGVDPALLRTFQLLGDPALLLQLAQPPAAEPIEGCCGDGGDDPPADPPIP